MSRLLKQIPGRDRKFPPSDHLLRRIQLAAKISGVLICFFSSRRRPWFRARRLLSLCFYFLNSPHPKILQGTGEPFPFSFIRNNTRSWALFRYLGLVFEPTILKSIQIHKELNRNLGKMLSQFKASQKIESFKSKPLKNLIATYIIISFHLF